MNEYFMARVLANPNQSPRNKTHVLSPGDVISLNDSYQLGEPLPAIVFYMADITNINNPFGTIKAIESNNIELMVERKMPEEFKIGNKFIIKRIAHRKYGKEFVIVNIDRDKDMLFYASDPLNQYSQCMAIESSHVELTTIVKCNCNFFEREVYGCQCGYIVG